MKPIADGGDFFRAFAGFAVSVLMLWGALMLFTYSVGIPVRLKYESAYLLADSVLVMSPFWLLAPKRRWLAVIPVAVLALFMVSSEMYYRYWGTFLPLKLVFSTSSWNGFVFGSLPTLFSLVDLALILIPVVLGVFFYLMGKHKAWPLPWRSRWWMLACSVGVWALVFAGSLIQSYGYVRSTGMAGTPAEVWGSRWEKKTSLYDRWRGGLAVYMCREVESVLAAPKRMVLSEGERNLVRRCIYANGRQTEGLRDVFAQNRDKNLILIIVESLNAEIVGKIYGGRPLTPVLDSLLKAPGTVAALDVRPQIDKGGSSDGQLIYNTGLLPVNDGCTAMDFGANDFPSLAKALCRHSSVEFIVEEGRIWNHNITSRSYGYDRLYDAADLERLGPDPAVSGSDAAVFGMALREMPKLSQLFFAEIVTLSMHFPYDDPGVRRAAWIDRIKGAGGVEKNYMQMVNYFDTSLGIFLEGLRRCGLSGSSVIAIASDHDQLYKDVEAISTSKNVLPIVFMAIGTGVTARVEGDNLQMDVFPTLLDIMGCDAAGYRGFGRSMLRPGRQRRTHQHIDILKEASDLYIRSDYRKRN